MITIHFFNAQGLKTSIQAKTGISLMKAALAENIEGIAADCGGVLTCATCHVFIRPAFEQQVGPAHDEESSMLEFAVIPPRPNSRLSCQVILTDALDGLEVDLPERQY
ncbi:MAG: 2Fe-2S iron-sulfur cluster-binding protein [Burkholderiaceae bacterium]